MVPIVAKFLSFEIVEGKIIIAVDPNKDGEPVLELMIDIKEIPDEVISIIKK